MRIYPSRGGIIAERAEKDAGDAKAKSLRHPKRKIAFGVVVLLALAALYWGLSEAGVLSTLTDKQALREWIDQLGPWVHLQSS